MGSLHAGKIALPLFPNSLVGRAAGSHIHLRGATVSSRHAEIVWRPPAWRLRALATSNETFHNGDRIEPGVWVPLGVGDHLRFGQEPEEWILADAEPPGLFAAGPAGFASGLDGVLLLPSVEAPEIAIE